MCICTYIYIYTPKLRSHFGSRYQLASSFSGGGQLVLRVSVCNLNSTRCPPCFGPWVGALARRSSQLATTLRTSALPARALACWAHAAVLEHGYLHDLQRQRGMRVPMDLGFQRPLPPVQEVLLRPPSPGGATAPCRGMGQAQAQEPASQEVGKGLPRRLGKDRRLDLPFG